VLMTCALRLPGAFQVENVMAAFVATMHIADMLVAGPGCRHAAALALATTPPLTTPMRWLVSLLVTVGPRSRR